MSLFSSFTKGLGAVLTGGTSSLMGSKDRGSYFDVLDPGNILHQGSAERTANEQWNLEYDLAKKNYDHTIDAYEYQKTLNEQQRQDNLHAVENRVADLKSAGLSPTLAAGSAASVTPVHAGSAPQMVAPTHSKVEAAMFREQMEKDYMQLAMGMMSNMADISRTKAETELIAAQKNKMVQETPVDLRIKEELANLNEQLHSIKIDQAKQNLTNSEADYITKLWSHVASQDEHLIQTTKLVREELGVKLDEQALRIGQTEENLKKTEALIKGYALELEKWKLKTEEELQEFYGNFGVPRGVHDKPAYAPFTLIRGLVEGADKGGRWLWKKAESGLTKLTKGSFDFSK